MSNKIIISSSTLDIIDAAFNEVNELASRANEFASIAEQKAIEARARYNELLAQEGSIDHLLQKTSLLESELLLILGESKQASMKVGTEIRLSNSNSKSDVWVVAGVNHDGTSGTVDLVSKHMVQDSTKIAYNGQWGFSNKYDDSSIRTWLNGTFINGFSTEIQNALKKMEVKTSTSSTGSTGSYDKIKLLSMTEVGLSDSDFVSIPTLTEGTIYPIFESGNEFNAREKRKKHKVDGTTSHWYWTRTRSNNSTSNTCYVNAEGGANGGAYSDTNGGIVPVIRL